MVQWGEVLAWGVLAGAPALVLLCGAGELLRGREGCEEGKSVRKAIQTWLSKHPASSSLAVLC